MIYKKIYCFWTGNNELSADRRRCLLSIFENSGVEVKLITPHNIDDIIIEPLHEAYEYLSLTHKSDYLRAYCMYHHGGGYTDIKMCDHSWVEYFDARDDSGKYMIGYRELHPDHIATTDFNREYLRSNYSILPGCGKFIFEKNTPVAKEWLDSVNNILDSKLESLKLNSGLYHPRAIYGGVHQLDGAFLDSKYPLEWNEIMGRVFHNTMIKYVDRIMLGLPYVNMNQYR